MRRNYSRPISKASVTLCRRTIAIRASFMDKGG